MKPALPVGLFLLDGQGRGGRRVLPARLTRWTLVQAPAAPPFSVVACDAGLLNLTPRAGLAMAPDKPLLWLPVH
jgi:hypothetical protein